MATPNYRLVKYDLGYRLQIKGIYLTSRNFRQLPIWKEGDLYLILKNSLSDYFKNPQSPTDDGILDHFFHFQYYQYSWIVTCELGDHFLARIQQPVFLAYVRSIFLRLLSQLRNNFAENPEIIELFNQVTGPQLLLPSKKELNPVIKLLRSTENSDLSSRLDLDLEELILSLRVCCEIPKILDYLEIEKHCYLA